MEHEDTKWVVVLSKSKEALYYRNKITGQQKWTTKNCFCSNAKRNIVPVKPCCVKDSSTKQEIIENQDIYNSNMAENVSFEMLSEKAYCLSDIIKDLQILSPPQKRRKRYKKVKNLFTKVKQRGRHLPKAQIQLLPFSNVALENSDVSLETHNVSKTTDTASMVEDNIPALTNAISIPRQNVIVEADFVAPPNDSLAASTVSMETENVPVVMIGTETQCVSISTGEDGLERVDEISNTTTKIDESNAMKSCVLSMDKVEFSDSKDNALGQFKESEDETTNLCNEVQDPKAKNNVLNINRGSNMEPLTGSDDANFNDQSVERKQSCEEGERQRPTKHIPLQLPPLENATSVEGYIVTADSSVNGQAHVKKSTHYFEAMDSSSVGKGEVPPSDIKSQGSHEIQCVSEEQVIANANLSKPLESENITVVGNSGSPNLYSNGQDIGNSEISTPCDKSSIQVKTHMKRGRGRPPKKRRRLEDIIAVVQPHPSHIGTTKKADPLPTTTSSSDVNFDKMPAKSLKVSADSPTHLNPSAISHVKKPCGGPRNDLLPNDLPTMVSIPGFPSQPTSPANIQPHEAVEDPASLETTPTIKFVSDSNIHVTSGTMFFYPQNSKQSTPARQTRIKKLESIADSLKGVSCKNVRGDSSVQTAAWLINVLTEIDLKKNNNQQTKMGSQFNSGVKDFSSLKPCQRNVSTPIAQPKSCSVAVYSGSTTTGTNERQHQCAGVIVQPAPSVNIPPRVQIIAKSSNKVGVSEVHASYVDLSWRIVTSSNGLNWTSLKSFYKLVPVRRKDEDGCSFLGIAVHSNNQVIAKLLNTTIPEEKNMIFAFEHTPYINRSSAIGRHHAAVVLSFEWDKDAVVIMPNSQSKSNDSKGRSNFDKFLEGSVGLQLPKPVKLPEKGCRVYLGDFQVIDKDVNFVVSHCVIVSKTPRPYLSIPDDALAQHSSNSNPATRCRVLGQAKNDVKTARSVGNPAGAENRWRRCLLCAADLMTPYDVKHHRRIHPPTLGFTCSECPKRFLTVGRLSVHLDTHRCHLVYTCANCKKRFDTVKVLSDKDFLKYYNKLCYTCRYKTKCKKCNLYFPSREKLNQHTIEKHTRTVSLQTRAKATTAC